MLTTSLKTVNHCKCDTCGHQWDSLTMPVTCGKCLTRTWNGAKTRGRPRKPLEPGKTTPAKIRKPRIPRKELTEYSKEW